MVVLAQEEARSLSHNYIGSEHVLLGLLREEEGLAAQALRSLDVSIERVRAQVVRIVGSGEEVTTGQIPFTPRAKKILELALREALNLGHNYIGTEHILLGLVRENEGVAARILLDCDVDAEKVRGRVVRMLASAPRARVVTYSHATGAGHEIDGAWLGAVEQALRTLGPELRAQEDRPPDSGDLLLALASAPRTRAAQALVTLGVDLDALAAAVRQARSADGSSAAEISEQLASASARRDQAAEAQNYEAAAKFRDAARALATELAQAELTVEELEVIRARLGLTGEDRGEPSSAGPPGED